MLGLLVVVTLLLVPLGALTSKNISASDYPLETHQVITEDGYILGLQRIPHGRNLSPKNARKVVLLMHGITAGSNSFTYSGPKYAMAYNLADAGYDVWLGNARGNAFSRRHVSLDPDKDNMKFFDFNFEDIALYDLPAMIDYALLTTGQKKLHYIGFSMGGSIFYALNSRTSAYHSKIASAYLLAGIGYQYNLPNIIIRLLSKSVDVLYSAALLSKSVELVPTPLVLNGLEILLGDKPPAELIIGTSVKTLIHYIQNMRDKSFCSWNYGVVENLKKYNSFEPTPFDLSKININVTVFYSSGDTTQSPDDALAMVRAMPNARGHKVGRDNFSHVDYMTAKDAKELITDYIIKSLEKS